MPTLKEYILTLRTYNPGISDKTITLYLLKLGKRIEDIQLAFKEVNPIDTVDSVNLDSFDTAPTPIPISISATSPTPTPTPASMSQFGVTKGATVAPGTPFVPTVPSASKVMETTEIEIMPEELSSQSPSSSSVQPLQSPVLATPRIHSQPQLPEKPVVATPIVSAAVTTQTTQASQTLQALQTPQTEIHHQSFDHLIRLQDMIKDLDTQGSGEKDLIIEPAGSESNQPYAGLEPKNQPGSSMQRKKCSYEELFGPTPNPVVETTNKTVGTPEKDPTVSYVGGSIIAGQGSGAFTFNASPTVTTHVEDGYATDHIGERTEEKIQTTSQIGVGAPIVTSRSMSGVSSAAFTGMPTKTRPIAPIQTTQGARGQAVDTKINIQTVPRKKGIVKKIILFIVLITIAFGGIFGYTRYVHGVYLFVKAPYAVDTFIAQLGMHLASMQTAKYEAVLNLSTVTPSESDEVFIQQIKSLSLPLGSKIALGIAGTYQKDSSSRDNAFSIKGSYADSGMTLDIDIDSVTNNGVLYFKINSLPSFLFDLSQIQGKWIAVTPEDIETVFGREVLPIETSMMETLEKVVASGAFSVVDKPQKIITSQQKAQYVYEVAVRFDALFTLLQKMNTEEGGIALEQISPEMREYIDYLGRHTKVLITVDSKGNLVEINIQSDTTTALATTGQKLKTISLFSIKTKDINQSIKVVSPEKIDMNSIDAYALITGQGKEGIMFEQQLSRVLQVDREIMNYIDINQKTPGSLKEIIESSNIGVKDIFLNPVGEFGYTETASAGYELTYHMKLPPVPSSYYTFLDDFTIGPDATSKSSAGSVEKYNTGINTTNKKPILTLRFVEGKNTATTDVLSKEALATLSKDQDKDGLSDTLEAYLELNASKADTDSDGASDMAELRQGTNPKGIGSWAEAYGSKKEDDMFKGDIE